MARVRGCKVPIGPEPILETYPGIGAMDTKRILHGKLCDICQNAPDLRRSKLFIEASSKALVKSFLIMNRIERV